MDLDELLDRQRLVLIQFEKNIGDKLAKMKTEMQMATHKLTPLLEETSELMRVEKENSSLRDQVAWYEKRKAELDSLMGELIEDTKMLQHKSDTLLTDELRQLECAVMQRTNQFMQANGVLSNIAIRLATAEGSIKKLLPKTPSSTGEMGEMESNEAKKDRIETRIVDIQKEVVEMESKANGVVAVHNSNLGAYSLLYNAAYLIFQVHIDCKWSSWVCVGPMLIFVVLLLLQVGMSYTKIKNIGKKGGSLIRLLSHLRQEAQTLANTIPQQSSSNENTRDPQTNSFRRSVLDLAATSDLERSISRFSIVFLVQLILPALCLISVFAVMMSSFCQDCVGEAPAPIPWNIRDLNSVYPDYDKAPPPAPAHGLG